MRPGTVVIVSFMTVFAVACGGLLVKRPPTHAHIHVGHTLHGWPATPDQGGILPTAEREATQVMEAALQATRAGADDLPELKRQARRILRLMDPDAFGGGEPGVYRVKRGAVDAVSHLEAPSLASTTTPGSKTSSLSESRTPVSQLSGMIPRAIAESTSAAEAVALADELVELARQTVDGESGVNKGHYGLRQLRADIDRMLERENPPYAIIDT